MNNDLYINAFLNNDSRIIKDFYKSTYPMMTSFVNTNFPMLSDDEVKDIFQESVIALWTNIKDGTYQDKGSKLSTYVIQIGKFKILDKLKKKSHQMEKPIADNLDYGEEQTIIIEEDPMVEKVKLILKSLPDRCKEILTMFYYNQDSLEDIALATGIGASSIKNEKYRCMKKLKEKMI